MHQMLFKEGLMPDLAEAREVHAQLDALHQLLSEKIKSFLAELECELLNVLVMKLSKL